MKIEPVGVDHWQQDEVLAHAGNPLFGMRLPGYLSARMDAGSTEVMHTLITPDWGVAPYFSRYPFITMSAMCGCSRYP
ncbi:hypothetical protein IPC1147_34130 [Pseudomonas aeruginosa]|nr:hypothetical protein IPC353_28565 [Pseudomonas aeruginosa]RRS16420.1 hypothetical protein IPC1107_34260 [Pseudomonas aeruginosa]RRS17694.1 hypothetical protein IPC1147_34130 [Pseudomonas aeruginosa]